MLTESLWIIGQISYLGKLIIEELITHQYLEKITKIIKEKNDDHLLAMVFFFFNLNFFLNLNVSQFQNFNKTFFKAFFALANITGDNESSKKILSNINMIDIIISLFSDEKTRSLEFCQELTWFLSIFFKGFFFDSKNVKKILLLTITMLYMDDDEVIINCLSILSIVFSKSGSSLMEW